MPLIRPHNTSVQAFKQAAHVPALIHNRHGLLLETRTVEIQGSAAGVKTMELQALGPPVRRLAQVKHFSARRTVRGAVTSSERVMSRASGRLDERESEDVRAWLEDFETACGNGRVGPAMIRSYVGRAWDEFAIPVPDRRGTYYMDAGDAARVAHLDAFLTAVAPGSYALALPLAPDCPKLPFIDAVEDHFTHQFTVLENLGVAEGTLRNRQSAWKKLATGLDEYEEKLGVPLSRAHGAAASARQMIWPRDHTKKLPGVDRQ